jgi:hypothetical protein
MTEDIAGVATVVPPPDEIIAIVKISEYMIESP